MHFFEWLDITCVFFLFHSDSDVGNGAIAQVKAGPRSVLLDACLVVLACCTLYSRRVPYCCIEHSEIATDRHLMTTVCSVHAGTSEEKKPFTSHDRNEERHDVHESGAGIRSDQEQLQRALERKGAKGIEPSMLADVVSGRRMEVEAVLGNLMRIAGQLGVSVPRIETLDALLR